MELRKEQEELQNYPRRRKRRQHTPFPDPDKGMIVTFLWKLVGQP